MSSVYHIEPEPRRARAASGELSPLTLVNTVLRERVLIVRLGIVGGLLVGGLMLLKARTYTAVATFIPQAKRAPSNVSGLAAQFGVNLGGSDATQTPQFYANLVTSRTLLGRLAESRLATPLADSSRAPTLESRLDLKPAATPALQRDAAILRLRRAIAANTDVKTGLVSVTVTLPEPQLARQAAERLIELVNQFNLERRRSQAVTERQFAEEQVQQAAGDLRTAEERYSAFVARNRDFSNAPELALAGERLQRAVTMREQVYVTLAQAYEQAKLDEVRNTPVITVVEEPEAPVRPDPRGVVPSGIAGGVAGLVLGLVIAFARRVARGRDEGDELAEFRALRSALAADVKRPWRLLGAGR